MKRPLLAVSGAALLATAGGCFKLDPFLYTPERTDVYHLDLDGGVPEERIDASQVQLLTIKENEQIQLGAVYAKATVQPPLAYGLFMHGKGNTLEGEFNRVKRMANMGYDVLEYDYRGFGASTNVTPTEEGVGEDGRAVLAWMVDAGIPKNRIFYYGHSFGTAASAQLAETNPPFTQILESGFASLADFKKDESDMDFPVSFITKDTWDTIGRVSRSHVPVMFIHGIDDTYVRPLFSEEMYAASPDPADQKKLVLVPGAGHSNSPDLLGPEMAVLVRGWVQQFAPDAGQ